MTFFKNCLPTFSEFQLRMFLPRAIPLYSTVSNGLSLLNSSNCFSIHNIYGRHLYLYPWRSIIFWTFVLLLVWCLLSVVLKETVMIFCLLRGDASYLPSVLTVLWFCDSPSLMEEEILSLFLANWTKVIIAPHSPWWLTNKLENRVG